MKRLISERLFGACAISTFLVIFRVFGPIMDDAKVVLTYISMISAPFVTAIVSEVLLHLFNHPYDEEVGMDVVKKRNIAFRVLNTVFMCIWIFVVMKLHSTTGAVNMVEFCYFAVSVIFINICIGTFWFLLYQKRQLAKELDLAASAIQAKVESYHTDNLLATTPQAQNAISVIIENNNEGKDHDNASIGNNEKTDSDDDEKEAKAIDTVKSKDEVNNENETKEEDSAPAEAEGNEVTDKKETLSDIVTLTGTTRDSLELRVEELLYVKSEGNYVRIEYFKDGQGHMAMLRMGINVAQAAFDGYSNVVRCHRSYLVNMDMVHDTEGRANGLTLVLKNKMGKVPVSRSYDKELKSQIQHMKCAMLTIVMMLGITIGMAGNAVENKAKVDDDSRYIQYMDSIDHLSAKGHNLKAMHVAQVMMNTAKTKKSSVGIVCASYKLYELYTIRRNADKSAAYIDTMLMHLPNAKMKPSKALKRCLTGGSLRLDADKYEREEVKRIDELKKQGRYKEAYEKETMLTRRADSIYHSLADGDCDELTLMQENERLAAEAERKSMEIAKQKMSKAEAEEKKAELAADIADMKNGIKEGQLAQEKLDARQRELEHKLSLILEQEKNNELKAATKENNMSLNMMYTIGVIALVALMMLLYFIYRHARNLRRIRKVMSKVAIVTALMLPVSASAQVMNQKCIDLYVKADASMGDSAKFFMYKDSLELVSKELNDKMGLAFAACLEMTYYISIFQNNPNETKLLQSYKLVRERGKAANFPPFHWLGWTSECEYLLNTGRYEDSFKTMEEMKRAAKDDIDGLIYYYRTAVMFYCRKGAKQTAEENLYRLEEANNRRFERLPMVGAYNALCRIEKDPRRRVDIYNRSLSNCSRSDSVFKLLDLVLASAECVDKELFTENYRQYKLYETVKPMTQGDKYVARNELHQLSAYEAAYDGNSAEAYRHVDSLDNFYKNITIEKVSAILGDYNKSTEFARTIRDERYKKYASVVEYDSKTLAAFVENDRLRRLRAEQELALLNLQTEQLALESEQERMMADSLDASTKLLQAQLSKERLKEIIRQNERELESQQMALALAEQKRLHKESVIKKHIAIMSIIMLSMITTFAGLYYRIQLRDSKDLKLLEDVMNHRNNTAA